MPLWLQLRPKNGFWQSVLPMQQIWVNRITDLRLSRINQGLQCAAPSPFRSVGQRASMWTENKDAIVGSETDYTID